MFDAAGRVVEGVAIIAEDEGQPLPFEPAAQAADIGELILIGRHGLRQRRRRLRIAAAAAGARGGKGRDADERAQAKSRRGNQKPGAMRAAPHPPT